VNNFSLVAIRGVSSCLCINTLGPKCEFIFGLWKPPCGNLPKVFRARPSVHLANLWWSWLLAI